MITVGWKMEKVIWTGYLLGVSWYDIRKKAVPLWSLLLGGAGVVADIVFVGGGSNRVTAILPGLLLLLLSKATKGIGEADGIILGFTGLISREINSFLIFGISLLYIFFCSMILFFTKRNGKIQIPYIPFLLAAYITAWKLL